MAEPQYGYATEYARMAHIVAFPASNRTALCGVDLPWIPGRPFPPESVHAECKAALKNGAQAAHPDDWTDNDTNPKDTK